ncbi:programmed cell death protein 1 isoform X1 [Leopardus geoffroyi]|uniref:programmed cell death protein 1 isoform X1 n=1 Tax=Leopardus geoffroyi TaxID=46844 RepID=UPI001E260888|nr:programmed cell death protein 1 isoform X1 [Leopardus geoffroyi]
MGTPRAPWPLVWAVLQLGWWPGWLLDSPYRPWSPLTFSPAQLTVLEGENATFVCHLPDVPESFVLNWYRVSPRNQTDKLAAFQENHTEPGKDRRFRVTRLPSGQDFHTTILAAQLNDSGIYLCGAIYLPPNTQIYESPRAELTVKERVLEPPTESPSPPPRLTGQGQGLVVGITSVLVGVLLLLLLTWVLAAAFPRATRGNIVPNPTAIPRRQSPRHNPRPHPPGIPTIPLPPPRLPPAPSQRGPLKEGLGLEQASQVPGPPVPNTCFKEGWGGGRQLPK